MLSDMIHKRQIHCQLFETMNCRVSDMIYERQWAVNWYMWDNESSDMIQKRPFIVNWYIRDNKSSGISDDIEDTMSSQSIQKRQWIVKLYIRDNKLSDMMKTRRFIDSLSTAWCNPLLMCVCMPIHTHAQIHRNPQQYGVAMISRRLKIIGLFCRV